jgi:hypothetical protein
MNAGWAAADPEFGNEILPRVSAALKGCATDVGAIAVAETAIGAKRAGTTAAATAISPKLATTEDTEATEESPRLLYRIYLRVLRVLRGGELRIVAR